MAVLHEDLEALYEALRDPTAEIMYQGRKQTFRSVAEIERQIFLTKKELRSGSGKPKMIGYRINVSKGV